MYPDQIRKNDYSRVSDESSGTAQKTILKEEFYRTYIMVAGQIRFWTVLPAGIDYSEYNRLIKMAFSVDSENYIKNNYIDLANLSKININECPGALLWQINKSMKNPAKSLIKTSLITSYYFLKGNDSVPCEIIKKKYSQCTLGDHIFDPYNIIFDQIIKLLEITKN